MSHCSYLSQFLHIYLIKDLLGGLDSCVFPCNNGVESNVLVWLIFTAYQILTAYQLRMGYIILKFDSFLNVCNSNPVFYVCKHILFSPELLIFLTTSLSFLYKVCSNSALSVNNMDCGWGREHSLVEQPNYHFCGCEILRLTIYGFFKYMGT